jgi:hypothetical protein
MNGPEIIFLLSNKEILKKITRSSLQQFEIKILRPPLQQSEFFKTIKLFIVMLSSAKHLISAL